MANFTKISLGRYTKLVYAGKKIGNTEPKFGDSKEVAANTLKLLKILDPNIDCLQAISAEHQNNIAFINDSKPGLHIVCGDGIITDIKNIGLSLSAGDCIQMVVTSNIKPCLGLVHVGSLGADIGIHITAIKMMANKFNIDISDFIVYLGPHIKKQSYKFDKLKDICRSKAWAKYVHKKDGYYFVDLTGRVVGDLLKLGVKPSNLSMADVDTGSNQNYYSHHRSSLTSETEGRNGFICALV